MARFSTQGSHSGILRTQKLRSPVENLQLTGRFPQWVRTETMCTKMCHFALIDGWMFFCFYIVICLQVTLRSWRDVNIQELTAQGQRTFRVWTLNMTDSWWTASALNTADTELTWMLLTRYPTDNWILDWTLPTLNNSRQTMNAVNCNLANTEDHWLCMLQLYPIAWTLKKLNWCYRLWTLLALNAIELSQHSRLTLNTLYTESYWHINSTELTYYTEHYIIKSKLLWTLHIILHIHTTKHLKSRHGIPHHTAISRHHFTPYALHHTILHHFTLCSPSRPQTFHIIQHAIPHHTL